jgi:hypothetical protein
MLRHWNISGFLAFSAFSAAAERCPPKKNRRRDPLLLSKLKVRNRIYLAADFFFAGAAGAAAFFATFLTGAFLAFVVLLVALVAAVFFAGAFFAGISYPPFQSAVAES